MKQDYYCLARSATFFSFTTYSVRWMLSFVLSPEERTIDCLSKIAQGKYTAVTSPSFAFVWCFKRNQCSEQLGTGHVWHGSESCICDLVCATPMHRQLKQAAHCTRIYSIYIRHHKTHTRTGGPGSECVELIWALWYCAPVQFTPHSFVSPSFIGRRSFQDSEIRVYHGISWISQIFDYRTFQDRVAQLPIICLGGFCHKSLWQTRSTRSSMQTSFSLIRPTSGRNGYMMFFNMF